MSDFKRILADLNSAGVDLRDLEIAHGKLPDSRSDEVHNG
jgi:hypothetical protein